MRNIVVITSHYNPDTQQVITNHRHATALMRFILRYLTTIPTVTMTPTTETHKMPVFVVNTPQITNQIAETVLKHLLFDDDANLDDLLELPDRVIRTVLNMGQMEPAYYISKHVPAQQYHVFQEHMLKA